MEAQGALVRERFLRQVAMVATLLLLVFILKPQVAVVVRGQTGMVSTGLTPLPLRMVEQMVVLEIIVLVAQGG